MYIFDFPVSTPFPLPLLSSFAHPSANPFPLRRFRIGLFSSDIPNVSFYALLLVILFFYDADANEPTYTLLYPYYDSWLLLKLIWVTTANNIVSFWCLLALFPFVLLGDHVPLISGQDRNER